jgi:hypothetical protein
MQSTAQSGNVPTASNLEDDFKGWHREHKDGVHLPTTSMHSSEINQ